MIRYITVLLIALCVIKPSYSSVVYTTPATSIVDIDETLPLDYLETDWPAICKNGLKQTPIDIPDRLTNKVVTTNSTLIKIVSSNYSITNGESFKIIHNEKFNLDMAGMGNIIVIKNGITYSYDILNIHLHILSEHTINGTQYDLEMHLVHSKNTNYLKNTGVTQDPDPNTLLVVGLMFKFFFNEDNSDIQKMNFGTLTPVIGLDMNPYVKHTKNFYHYSGGLTTPGCTETVNWVVMEDVETIGVYQFKEIKNLIMPLYPHGNSRMTKPLNGRTVYYVQNSSSRYLQIAFFMTFLILFL
jgi:carbonic anhydrase